MKTKQKPRVRLAAHLDTDAIDDLIDPVCKIANMNRTGSDPEFNALIEAARVIKEREGFAVLTYKL